MYTPSFFTLQGVHTILLMISELCALIGFLSFLNDKPHWKMTLRIAIYFCILVVILSAFSELNTLFILWS